MVTGSACYVTMAGRKVKGVVRYVKGHYVGVILVGERGAHEWPREWVSYS